MPNLGVFHITRLTYSPGSFTLSNSCTVLLSLLRSFSFSVFPSLLEAFKFQVNFRSRERRYGVVCVCVSTPVLKEFGHMNQSPMGSFYFNLPCTVTQGGNEHLGRQCPTKARHDFGTPKSRTCTHLRLGRAVDC